MQHIDDESVYIPRPYGLIKSKSTGEYKGLLNLC